MSTAAGPRCTHVCGRPHVRPMLCDRARWRSSLYDAQDRVVRALSEAIAHGCTARDRDAYHRLFVYVRAPPALLHDYLDRVGLAAGPAEAFRMRELEAEHARDETPFTCSTLFEVDEETAPIDPCDGRAALIHFGVSTLAYAHDPPHRSLDALFRVLLDAGDACMLRWFRETFVTDDRSRVVVARRVWPRADLAKTGAS